MEKGFLNQASYLRLNYNNFKYNTLFLLFSIILRHKNIKNYNNPNMNVEEWSVLDLFIKLELGFIKKI